MLVDLSAESEGTSLLVSPLLLPLRTRLSRTGEGLTFVSRLSSLMAYARDGSNTLSPIS